MDSAAYTKDTKMPFGPHKGKPLGQLPDEYVTELLSSVWLDQHPRLYTYFVLNRPKNVKVPKRANDFGRNRQA